MTDNLPPPPEVSAVLDSKLPLEEDHQGIIREMERVIEMGMRNAQAIGYYSEGKVVDELLGLATPDGKKLLFTRAEVFSIFRRQQELLFGQRQGGNPLG